MGNQFKITYPWDSWLKISSEPVYLKEGIDYRIARTSMRQQIRNAAVDRGLRVLITEVDNGLVVSITGLNKKGKAELEKETPNVAE